MWNKCVIAVKGICNAAPWSQTDLSAPSVENLDIPRLLPHGHDPIGRC